MPMVFPPPLHSQRDDHERRSALQMAQTGELRLLYVSPERLAMGDLLPSLMPKLCSGCHRRGPLCKPLGP